MKKLVALVLAALMVISLGACAPAAPAAPSDSPAAPGSDAPADPGSDAPADPGSDAPAASGARYAIITKSTGNPYNDRESGGFADACKELGVEAIIKDPANPNAEDQIAMIQELVTQEVNGIAIAANDVDALEPALKQAMNAGIPVATVDSSTNAASRNVFVNQADTNKIGQTLVDAAYDLCGGEGQFAILSATAQATNQNAWIDAMKEVMKDPKYSKLELVKVAYGDDLRDKSTSETEGLLQSYPDLKCIVAPTTVGIMAAAKVVTDQNSSVKVTGLGLPSEMAEFIENGVCPYMYLWNPIDLGYLTGYTLDALVKGTITGAAGDKFSGGKLGEYEVVEAADGGTEVLLGPPFEFNPENIAEWKEIY